MDKDKEALLELVVGATKRALGVNKRGAGLKVIRDNPAIRAALDDPKFAETFRVRLQRDVDLWVEDESIATIEHRLRETLKRRGYRLEKSRRRDPHALTYGRYWIIKERPPMTWASFHINATEGDADRAYTMTLGQVDAWCASGKSGHPGFESAFIPMIACQSAMDAYIAERRETTPEKEAAKTKRPRTAAKK